MDSALPLIFGSPAFGEQSVVWPEESSIDVLPEASQFQSGLAILEEENLISLLLDLKWRESSL